MFERVAVVGCGAMGTVIGARLNANGVRADLVDAYQAHVDALNEKGATITGNLEMNVPVHALTPDGMEGIYDLVILLTKQTANPVVLGQLLPHLGPESLVLTLQNGIPEEYVAEVVGARRTAGGAIDWGATFVGPGVTMYTSTVECMEKYAFHIGETSGEITPRIRAAAEILGRCGCTEITQNLLGIRWAKVLMNATFSGMSSALGSLFGDVLDDEFTLSCIAHIADETIQVANACGVHLEPMHGVQYECFRLEPGQTPRDKFATYHEVWDCHRKLTASMLQDLRRGTPCEIEFINGHVCKKGREVGVPTPFNDKVAELIRREQATGVLNTMADKIVFQPLFQA